MPMSLLTTKLYIPPARPELVSRPRLIEQLNAGLLSRRKLTLISAPAGFGKTSLMISQQRLLCDLVMLDASGNALACSLGCLAASLIKVLPKTFNRRILY